MGKQPLHDLMLMNSFMNMINDDLFRSPGLFSCLVSTVDNVISVVKIFFHHLCVNLKFSNQQKEIMKI